MNDDRFGLPVGDVTPQEAEEAFYENMNDLDKVA